MPIRDRRAFFPRLGTVSLGYQTDVKADGTKAKRPFPKRTDTLVFHSDDEETLKVVAEKFGGAVVASLAPEAEGGKWHVVTNAKEADCYIPASDDRGFDANYELWGDGGMIRRCDGVTCAYAVVMEEAEGKGKGEILRDVPCVCKALAIPEGSEEHCDTTTRLNVILPGLEDAPGVGVWQVQSRGKGTYDAIAGQLAVFSSVVGVVTKVPFYLSVDTRSVRVQDGGEVKSITVPRIRLRTRKSIRETQQLVAAMGAAAAAERAALPAPVPGAETAEDGEPEAPAPDRTRPPLGGTPGQRDAAREGEGADDIARGMAGDSGDEPMTPEDQKRLFARARELHMKEPTMRAIVALVTGQPDPATATTRGMTVRQLHRVHEMMTEAADAAAKARGAPPPAAGRP